MVSFTGLSSVADRTLYTNRGPIVKKPLPVLTGADLKVVSATEIEISSAVFTSIHAGYLIEISGSPGGRNDGTFEIDEVISSLKASLKNANLEITDVNQTINTIVALANNLRTKYDAHLIEDGIHGTNDTVNNIIAAEATDLPTAITLLNEIKSKFNAHIINISGDPPVHTEADTENEVITANANSLALAVFLANAIRKRYELHRQNRFIHLDDDLTNRITVDKAEVITGVYPGAYTGPFTWTIYNPRYGTIANDPTDVQVYVNSVPVSVDAVFGFLGAVVLSAKPGGTDTVTIDYSHMANPPARFMRLGTFEFNLNQDGNKGLCGFPEHRYRARSYLIDPSRSPDLMSAVTPLQTGWRYKGLERAYSAVLNDPNTLLLNVPTNKIAYDVLTERIPEVTIRYDPTSLPQNATDPWTLEGDGTFSLAAGGNELTIIDSNIQSGVDSLPPFFTHAIDLRADSIVSAAFRTKVIEYEPDGVFTGVAFGISDGYTVGIAGLIITEATNLSSAISMANDIRAKFEAHLTNPGSHNPDDITDYVDVVDATDLTSLVILLNDIKEKFDSHIAKGSGAGLVHNNADVTNPITSPDASDLDTSLTLVNELRTNFNAHRNQSGVHFSGDGTNVVEQIRQIGLLTNAGFPEFAESWDAYAADWSEYKTYRLYRDVDGNIELYTSGDTDPIVEIDAEDLPSASDLPIKFNFLQQAFFGSIRDEATSTSLWQFIRVNVAPVTADLIEDNKSVDYDGSVIPEQDPNAPWITVGHGGFERVLTGNILQVDSTAKAAEDDLSSLGLSTGAYRGFMRFEPILSRDTAISIEFKTAIDYYTFGINNKTVGLFLEDNNLSVHLLFLQYAPSAATTTGTVTEPYSIIAGNEITLQIGNNSPIVVSFLASDTTAANVVTRINTAAGFTFASVESGKIKLTSSDLGSTATFEIISGDALAKLGFSPGTYIGRDSDPDPKVSWYGANRPDLDDPMWTQAGTQSASMLGRTLRLTDDSNSDYITYSLSDPIVTNQAFNPTIDWKLDARFIVRSFAAGDPIPPVGPFINLYFCGALISVEEGTGGKNVELQLALDGSNDPYLNLLTYDSATNTLVVVGQYAFTWNDGQTHSYNIYTSKGTDSILVYADGVVLASIGPAPTYSGLKASSTSTPTITFGSGSEAVAGANISTARSVVDWESVAIFEDSKIGDPTAASRRYIGIYRGGDASLLASYDLHQIDWTSLHTYRIVRDPISAVSVYVDGGDVPVISIAYDVLSLPPSSSSFFNDITNDHAIVAFGSYSPDEISRSRWEFIKYSIGRITLTDRLVPQHHVLNRGNAIASPDHLRTKISHPHYGFQIYSGGTPLEDFLEDEDADSFTVLGEGTPPVPMTQDLESRGGLIKVGTPLKGIASTDLVNTKGYISNLQDDTVNVLTASAVTDTTTALTELITLVNDIQTQYNTHLTQAGVHPVNDIWNPSVSPVAVDLTTAITLVNELKSIFNAHRVETTGLVHDPIDTTNVVSVADATELASAAELANDIKEKYEAHRLTGNFHITTDSTNVLSTFPFASDYESSALLAIRMKEVFNNHRANNGGGYHNLTTTYPINEEIPGITVGTGGVPAALNTVENATFSVIPGERIVFLDGSNVLVEKIVATILTSTSFTVTVPFGFLDAGPSQLVKIDSPTSESHLAALANALKESHNAHRDDSGVHVTDDIRYPVTAADAYDLATAITLLNDIYTNYEVHRSIFGFVTHAAVDTANAIGAADASDSLTQSIEVLNDFREKYLLHVVQRRAHLADDDEHVILTEEATDLTTAIDLANSAKEEFNDHIAGHINEEQKIHSEDDIVNTVTAANATDLASLAILTEEIRTDYEAHRTEAGVHGASLFIRLDPPDRVLYEGMTFYQHPTGDEGTYVASISDDETARLDGIKHTNDVTISYTADALPADYGAYEAAILANDIKAQYNAHRIAAGVHPTDDLINIVTVADATDLTTAITLVNDIRTQFTAHLIETGVHIVDDDVNTPLDTPATELYTLLALVNELKSRYETHRPDTTFHSIADDVNQVTVYDAPAVQDAGWRIITDGPDSPTIALIPGYLRYTAVGSTSTSVCRNDSAIPDTDHRFELTTTLRINSWPAGPNIDTSIYAGFLSSIGPGVAAAIGFDVVDNIPYVKIQDVNSNTTMYRVPFNWADGNFHTYKMVRDLVTDTIRLVVVS